MALFSSTSRSQQSSNLVSFRAGKMSMRGTMVHPDKRKGLVYVYQSDDSLMHFCWKDRTTGAVEDDLIVFPDDIEFLPVKQCTTGRVFLLKFKNSSRKLFFWMQEPKSDKDDEFCRKVNELLNNPPAPGSARTMGARGSGAAGATPSGGQDMDFSVVNQLFGGSGGGSGSGGEDRGVDIQSVLSGMDQQQLMQLLNFVGGGGGSALSGLGLDSPSLVSGISPAAAASSSNRSVPASGIPAGTSSAASAATIPTPVTANARATVPSSTSAAAAESSTSGANPKPIQVNDLRNILSTLSVPGIPAPGGSKEDVDIQSIAEILEAEKLDETSSSQPKPDESGKKDKPDNDDPMDLD